ncbi:MAG: glycosyltransferase [Eubacteriales bacterium]|nr:glycosyltransferase [Eubacteriales bacterium]
MRIAIFTNAYKPILSGVVNMIDILQRSYIKKGHEVLILAPGYYDYVDEGENVFRYKWLNLTHDEKFPLAIPFSIKADRLIREFKPDVIHVHHPFIMSYAAFHQSRNSSAPLVFTFHTQYEQYVHYIPLPPDLVRTACRNKIKSFAGKCDAVTTPAKSIANLLESYGIKQEIHIIPNAVDLDSFKSLPPGKVEAVRNKYGLQGKKVIIATGRIAPEKNLHLLIDSFLKISDSSPSARLMIVGDGMQLSSLIEYAANTPGSSGKDKIIFTGKINYTDMPAYYKMADIFAITSVTEVKPLTILEALAAGLPVVAVNASGASDTLTDMYDSILTASDKDRYSEALLRILSDEALHGKLSKGALLTASGYSADSISASYLKLYDDLVGLKRVHGF